MMQQDWRDTLSGLAAQLGPVKDDGDDDVIAESEENRRDSNPGDVLHVVVERKGRGGKTATIVCGFTVTDAEIGEIAAQLRRKLGCGGSARGGEILVQGDRAADVRRLLSAMGYKIK